MSRTILILGLLILLSTSYSIGITGCQVINAFGSYTVNNDLNGFLGSTTPKACLFVNSSNVSISCLGSQ